MDPPTTDMRNLTKISQKEDEWISIRSQTQHLDKKFVKTCNMLGKKKIEKVSHIENTWISVRSQTQHLEKKFVSTHNIIGKEDESNKRYMDIY